VNAKGKAILCADCPNIQKLNKKIKNNSINYGFQYQADFQAKDIHFEKFISKCTIHYHGKKLGELSLKISGHHNILNALATVVVGCELGIKFEKISQVLCNFTGVKRRMEVVSSNKENIMILDDYAHHPTEVIATLNALKNSWKNRRVIVVFQPHRFTRTQLLAKKFGKAFFDADRIIINDIYSANEDPIAGVSGETIFNEIKNSDHQFVEYIPVKDNIVPRLLKIMKSGDIIITMGAGDIWTISRELAQKI
jgi:UDP-N-acetylmuramate--alanine ligase